MNLARNHVPTFPLGDFTRRIELAQLPQGAFILSMPDAIDDSEDILQVDESAEDDDVPEMDEEDD